jgi:hypothetical protein
LLPPTSVWSLNFSAFFCSLPTKHFIVSICYDSISNRFGFNFLFLFRFLFIPKTLRNVQFCFLSPASKVCCNIHFNSSNIESVFELKVLMKINWIFDGKQREKEKLKHKRKPLRTFEDCLIGIGNWTERISKEKERKLLGCLKKWVLLRDVIDVIDWIWNRHSRVCKKSPDPPGLFHWILNHFLKWCL